MKARIFMLVFAIAATASAQQRPTQINPGTGTGTVHPHHDHNPALTPFRYPMSAQRYELYVSMMLDQIRKSSGQGGISAGDVNKAILRIRDCASSIEADGWVTSGEGNHCQHVIMSSIPRPNREVLRSSH